MTGTNEVRYKDFYFSLILVRLRRYKIRQHDGLEIVTWGVQAPQMSVLPHRHFSYLSKIFGHQSIIAQFAIDPRLPGEK